jgi:hypothetical protein
LTEIVVAQNALNIRELIYPRMIVAAFHLKDNSLTAFYQLPSLVFEVDQYQTQ